MKDLKSLCVACKELQAVARPQLYHTLRLETSQLTDLLKKRLHHDNTGLKHVRALVIDDDRKTKYDYKTQGASLIGLLAALPEDVLQTLKPQYDHKKHGAALVHLLEALPKDVLQTFWLGTSKKVPLEVLYVLRTRQRQLTNEQLHPTEACLKVDIIPGVEVLQHVTSVQLYISTTEEYDRAYELIRRTNNVSSLDIRASHLPHDPDPTDIYAESVLRRILLCSTALDSHSRTNLKRPLQRLLLRDLDLDTMGDAVPGVIDPSLLSSVVLEQCSYSFSFLGALAGRTPKLRMLVDMKSDNVDDEADGIEKLLHQATGLETLYFSTYKREGIERQTFSYGAIQNHGQTLKVLHLDDFIARADPFGTNDQERAAFVNMCKACPKLEQLTMAVRGIEVPGSGYTERRLHDILASLKHLKAIKTIRLLISYNPETEDELSDDKATEHDMQNLANRVFEELGPICLQFAALVFDARQGEDGCMTFLRPKRYGFLRGQQSSGRTKVVGNPIEPHMIKHHEPCSDILEDDFGTVRK